MNTTLSSLLQQKIAKIPNQAWMHNKHLQECAIAVMKTNLTRIHKIRVMSCLFKTGLKEGLEICYFIHEEILKQSEF